MTSTLDWDGDWDDPCDALKEEECLRDEPAYMDEPPWLTEERDVRRTDIIEDTEEPF